MELPFLLGIKDEMLEIILIKYWEFMVRVGQSKGLGCLYLDRNRKINANSVIVIAKLPVFEIT